jgi:hypothetical protein
MGSTRDTGRLVSSEGVEAEPRLLSETPELEDGVSESNLMSKIEAEVCASDACLFAAVYCKISENQMKSL